MRRRHYTLEECANLYKSLMFLYGMRCDDATELIYLLYTANADSVHSRKRSHTYGLLPFYHGINELGRPARSLSGLATALEELLDNIIISPLTTEQRVAVRRAQGIVDAIHNDEDEHEDILIESLLRALQCR